MHAKLNSTIRHTYSINVFIEIDAVCSISFIMKTISIIQAAIIFYDGDNSCQIELTNTDFNLHTCHTIPRNQRHVDNKNTRDCISTLLTIPGTIVSD